MKSQFMILVLVGLVAFVHCLPSTLREREELDNTNNKPSIHKVPLIRNIEIELVPSFGFKDDDQEPNISLFDFPQFRNPFANIFNGFFNAMRRQTQDISKIFGLNSTLPFDQIPKNANKTSTTKVIDGHVVTINETTYRGDDPNSTFIFKIHTVDVKPDNSTILIDDKSDEAGNNGGEQIEAVTISANRPNDKTSERSVETVEEPGNNEIPDNQVETLQA